MSEEQTIEQMREYIAWLEWKVANPDIVDAIARMAGKGAPTGEGFVARQDKARTSVVEALGTTVQSVWGEACRRDNIEPTAPFVVFSPDNPVTQFLGPSQQQLREAASSGMALGYVGLELRDGRTKDEKPLKRPKAKK